MLRKLTITSLLFLTGCGLTGETKQYFILEMMGVGEAPATATGDTSPKWQQHTLFGVELLSQDGTENTTLFSDTENPRVAKIANRPQIIYSKDVSAQKNTTFSAVNVKFSTTVTGASKNSEDHTLTMAKDTFTLTEEFTLEEGKDKTLMVEVKWLNTVSGDTMQEPEFVLEFR